MRILVTGGRDYTNHLKIHEALLKQSLEKREEEYVLIHGAARGADTLAAQLASRWGWKIEAFPADWKEHGRAAGPIRNQKMIDEGKPDYGLVFPGGSGTKDMMTRLYYARIPFKFVGR